MTSKRLGLRVDALSSAIGWSLDRAGTNQLDKRRRRQYEIGRPQIQRTSTPLQKVLAEMQADVEDGIDIS